MRGELYTPVVGDVLDRLGFQRQFLPQPIQPMRESMKLAGRAMPVLVADVFLEAEPAFGKLTLALDDLRPGEIYMATGTLRSACWGEIMTAAARTRGAVGAVIDGWHRDTPQVLAQDWPVFSRGRWAVDGGARSSVIDFRCPIEIGDVRIEPGDLVFGDLDGILIVPVAVEEQAIEAALDKARAEKGVRGDIERGMSATEAFRKYGIL